MFRLLCFVLGVACAAVAFAAVKRMSWTPPTTYTDGSTLPAAELAGYDLTCNGVTVATNIPGGAVREHALELPPGDYSCTLRAFDIFGGVSDPSNTAVFQVPRPRPNAPAALSFND